MPRVQRNYQHKDFSYLLQTQENKLMNSTQRVVVKEPEVSEAKRRRDRLLANKKLKYVITHSGRIHDRDCAMVARISDETFDMCSDFPNGKAVCFMCYRRAMVRKGLRPDQMKYATAVVSFFDRLGATTSEINMLFVVHNATIEKVEKDCLCLKVNDDRWIIQITNGKCLLFHNNYHMINETERLLSNEFHMQIDTATTIRNAVHAMCRYTWAGHLRHTKEKQKALHRERLQRSVEQVNNVCRIPRFSLLFKYYRILDRDDRVQEIIQQDKLPVRIRKEKHIPDAAYSIVQCRILRGKEQCIGKLAEGIKAHCIDQLYMDYPECCRREFGDK